MRRSSPRGFTLVELLAALGISLLLIAAVSASLDIYVRVTNSGRVAIERQQITRALLDPITRDIASIIFRPAESAESTEEEEGSETDSSSGSENSTESESTIIVQDPQSAVTTSSLGLVGDASTLLLHISRPLDDLNYSPPQSAQSLTARTSDLLSVSYFLAEPGADGLSGAVANLYAASAADPTQQTSFSRGPAGLARLEGDRIALDRADVQQDDAALAAAAQVIAPEIATLQFRYFDGQAWVDSWDSTAMDRLPQAIEVTMGFRDPQAESNLPTGLSSVVPIGQTVRHVFHVPLSEPAAAVNSL